MNNNEKGMTYPIALGLLFFMLSIVFFYISSYQSQIKIINSLENINIRATIYLLENNK